jgi:hypothetical protein
MILTPPAHTTPLEREAEARAAAEQRMRELEAELAKRDRG